MAPKFFSSFSLVAALLAVAGLVTWLPSQLAGGYTVTAVLPAGNPNLIEGAPVYVDGFEAGTIEEIRPADNQAILTASFDDQVAPLHDGAFFHVQWKALVGERLLFVEDGPAQNAEIPDGGMVEGKFPKPTEIADVLAALDPKTRTHLSSLLRGLDDTLQGREHDLNQTVRTAGPALAALGEVLRGIGTDGPAINALVTDLNRTLAAVGRRHGSVARVVHQLSAATRATAEHRTELRLSLSRLPRTLDTAKQTLARVPGVTRRTLPLLSELRSATEPLPAVSRNLAPLLADLRPATAELKPTLRAASTLLSTTPGLLDMGHRTVPQATTATRDLMPALKSLRPYTPEAVAFLTSWGSAGQNYDANGHYMRIFSQEGLTSANVNPGVMPPGNSRDRSPQPGDAGKSADTDATGEGMH